MSGMLDSIAPDVDIAAEMGAEPEQNVEPQNEAPKEEAEVKQEEVKQEEVKQEKPEQPPQKMVPLAALHEERIRRREIERQYAEQKKALEDRLKQIENPVPKFEEDPANNLRHKTEAAEAKLEQLEKAVNQSRQAEEARVFRQQIAVHTQTAEQVFSKEHPDYNDAVKYLQSVADRNLQLMGIEDPAARQAQIAEDAMAMSLKALQAGKSPADVAYQLAQNYGYKPAQTTQTDPAKKLATLQQGQKAAVSMPGGGGKSAPLSIEALAQLDDEEFNKAIDDPATWKKLISQA